MRPSIRILLQLHILYCPSWFIALQVFRTFQKVFSWKPGYLDFFTSRDYSFHQLEQIIRIPFRWLHTQRSQIIRYHINDTSNRIHQKSHPIFKRNTSSPHLLLKLYRIWTLLGSCAKAMIIRRKYTGNQIYRYVSQKIRRTNICSNHFLDRREMTYPSSIPFLRFKISQKNIAFDSKSDNFKKHSRDRHRVVR